MRSNLQFPADLVTFTEEILKGWYTYDVHFEGCGVGWGGRWGRQKKGVIGRRGDMTRHHAEPNISMLLTRNLPFDLDVRQWSYPLMIPLPCLWAKSNNRTRMSIWMWHDTWFCFCFDFIRSYARCGCCSVVCLCFQVVQIKQVDCKMNYK